MKLPASLAEASHAILCSISHLRTYSRWFRLGLLLCVVAMILDLFLLIAIHAPPTRLLPIPKLTVEDSGLPAAINITERIYIASLAWNDEEILREYWIPALLNLASHCEKGNIYVSILESGSWDGTKDALRGLDTELEKLGVERSVVLRDKTHEDEINRVPAEVEKGWIWSTRGKMEMRRLPFLASTRNAAMEKLGELAVRGDAEGGSRTFDKVLWLNGDVIFRTEQVNALLATRNGDFAAACALDISDPPLFYDSFAMRDIQGNAALSQTYPYFLAHDSLDAVYSNSPIPVQSCWNSLTIFDAKPFYNNPPLSFRAIPDTLASKHIEASECCLIHVDNELSISKGVWLNPNVRVTYNNVSDAIVNPKGGGAWPTRGVKLKGVWAYRWIRWSQWLSRWLRDRRVSMRLQQWKNEPRQEGEDEHVEPGTVCLVDEMQVLLSNGWKHVR